MNRFGSQVLRATSNSAIVNPIMERTGEEREQGLQSYVVLPLSSSNLYTLPSSTRYACEYNQHIVSALGLLLVLVSDNKLNIHSITNWQFQTPKRVPTWLGYSDLRVET